jgi:hypothetical protein
VPADGKVCFWSDTTSLAEFENSFTYAAVDGSSNVGAPQTVTVVNYNVQLCPAIPDLGSSGFASVPPSPTVSITLSGLEIKFEVTAAYVRNQTAWCTCTFISRSPPSPPPSSLCEPIIALFLSLCVCSCSPRLLRL